MFKYPKYRIVEVVNDGFSIYYVDFKLLWLQPWQKMEGVFFLKESDAVTYVKDIKAEVAHQKSKPKPKVVYHDV